MARQDNNKILYDELVKIGADEKTAETFVMYLTQKERDDSLLAQIKYCGSFDHFFDKTSLMSKAASAIVKRSAGTDLKERFILACIALHGNEYHHLYSAISATPFDDEKLMDALISTYSNVNEAFVHFVSISKQEINWQRIHRKYNVERKLDAELCYEAAVIASSMNQMTALDLSNRALMMMASDDEKDYSLLANKLIKFLNPIIENQIEKIGSNDLYDKSGTGERTKNLLPTISKLGYYAETYKNMFSNLVNTLPIEKVVGFVRKEDNYFEELVSAMDRERLYKLADIFFDHGLFSEALNAINRIPEEEITEPVVSLMVASYNNLKEYDMALEALEKYKDLFANKLRVWYYYAAYACAEKGEYSSAISCIENGIEECNKEKEANLLIGEDFEEEIKDFEKIRNKCRS